MDDRMAPVPLDPNNAAAVMVLARVDAVVDRLDAVVDLMLEQTQTMQEQQRGAATDVTPKEPPRARGN